MPRIAPVTPVVDVGEGPDAGARIAGTIGGILQHRPEVAAALRAVSAALRATGTLPPRLLELVRLRIAFHNQCRSCMAVRYRAAVGDGLTEDAVCSLEDFAAASDLSPAERAAVEYADLLAGDHLANDDAVFERLREHFSEAEIVELGVFSATAIGNARLVASWRVVEDLPPRFREDGLVTPWGTDALVCD